MYYVSVAAQWQLETIGKKKKKCLLSSRSAITVLITVEHACNILFTILLSIVIIIIIIYLSNVNGVTGFVRNIGRDERKQMVVPSKSVRDVFYIRFNNLPSTLLQCKLRI